MTDRKDANHMTRRTFVWKVKMVRPKNTPNVMNRA